MTDLADIGKDLIQYAELEAAFSAQRSLLDELFPFIYVASKRMSLRAICRWLEETRRIKISVNALSKAMRNQEKYWSNIAEQVTSAANIFAEAHHVDPLLVLQDSDFFFHHETSDIQQAMEHFADQNAEYQRIATAAEVIRNLWFQLPQEAREQCYRHFPGKFSNAEEDTQEGGKDESGK